jgi:fused signal recognition particle receptor
MEELKKIQRVLARQNDGRPHEVLLVLDATMGQNGLYQARQFTESVSCDGIFLAKLDGTAKGGIVFAIADELSLPVLFVGTGEKADDIVPFDPEEFVEALFSTA